jgi:transposase InsO family protein
MARRTPQSCALATAVQARRRTSSAWRVRHTLEEAYAAAERIVEHYNHHRLHSAIGYVTPADKLAGREIENFRRPGS